MAAPAAFRLPEFDGLDPSVDRIAVDRASLFTVYYDTADLRLARWGCSLRYRRGQGWTLKLPQGYDGPLIVRAEHEFAGGQSDPPKPALDLLTAYLRGQSIVQVARLKTIRHRAMLDDAAGRRLTTITDDVVSVLVGRKTALRFRELEVELGEHPSNELVDRVVARLRDAGAGSVDPTPKVVRALGPQAASPPELQSVPVDAGATAGAVLRAALSDAVIQVLRQDAGIRLGHDPEPVHRARVALRHMRSYLRTFSPLFEAAWAGSLREALRELASQLGTVRDADVVSARVRADMEGLGLAAGPRRALLRYFDERRASGLRGLHESMRGSAYVDLLERLVDAARAPRLFPLDADQPAAQVLVGLAAADWRRLCKAVDALPAQPSDDDLHRIRIRAKRCRYGAEALVPVAGKDAKEFARKAAALQDVLGNGRDAMVERKLLAEFRSNARLAFDAGQLAGVASGSIRSGQDSWRDAWRSLARKRRRRWLEI